jgi:hypothetical protein
MAGPFATATEFCEWTGMAIPSDLARLQQLLTSASAMIRGESGQTLSQVIGDVLIVQPEYDATFGWRNPYPRASGGVIYLPEAPVTACTIVVDAVSFTAFTFNADGVVQRTDGKAWTKAATITYTHGFAETSEDFKTIKSICIEMVKRAYTGDERGTAFSQGGIPVETVGFPTALFITESERQSLPGLAAVG